MFDNLNLIPGEAFTATGSLMEKVIDKISNATEWIITPKANKKYQLEAEEYLIEQIKKDEQMPPLAKSACISNVRKMIKQYVNQNDIFIQAMNYFQNEEDLVRIMEVEDDWLQVFFDKAKNVAREDMKIIWSRLLAKEIKDPGSISRQLLHILMVIDQKEAHSFRKLSNYCIEADGKSHAVLYMTELRDDYLKNGFLEEELFRLEDIGLVQVSAEGYSYSLETDGKVTYFDKEIDMKDKKELNVGNVILSRAGEELMNILTEREPVDGYEEILSEMIHS